MTELYLVDVVRQPLTDNHGLLLCLDKDRLVLYRNSIQETTRVLSCSIDTRIGAIETILFVLQIWEENTQLSAFTVSSQKLFFVVNYFHKYFDVPYKLNGFEKLQARDWSVVFNSSDLGKQTELAGNTFLAVSERVNAEPIKNLDALQSDDFKISIVAYYSAPFMGVGTKRPEFFNEFFNSQNGVSSRIVSAVPNDSANHDFVPDYGHDQYNFNSDSRIATLEAEGISVIGSSWSQELKSYFEKQHCNNGKISDCVIFTGNPFYYFEVASYLKNMFGTYVVLDYRDPFAMNPLMYRSSTVQNIQTQLENEFNQTADLILAVNSVCKDLVVGEKELDKVAVIENGYDDDLFQSLPSKPEANSARLKFVYAGSFSKFRTGENFVKALSGTAHTLTYMGSDANFGIGSDRVERLGLVSGRVAIEKICKSDIGVVFATGEPFESTTKIYDYIGADLPILIVTNGDLNSGALEQLTSSLDAVYWVRNNERDIKNFLESVNIDRVVRPSKDRFSRAFHAENLLKIILERAVKSDAGR